MKLKNMKDNKIKTLKNGYSLKINEIVIYFTNLRSFKADFVKNSMGYNTNSSPIGELRRIELIKGYGQFTETFEDEMGQLFIKSSRSNEYEYTPRYDATLFNISLPASTTKM
jgi:hypothetical protein